MRRIMITLLCASMWALTANIEYAEGSCRGPRCGKHIARSIKTDRRTNLSARLLNCTNYNNPDCNRGLKLTKSEWAFLSNAFLKCTHWQVEETLDALNCPFHYYCSSAYPGNYPVIVDWLALALSALSWFLLAGTLLWEFGGDFLGREFNNSVARYCRPSGPAVLPFLLLLLAKGLRINTLFPLSYAAPALLQLLHISALGSPGIDPYGVSKNLNAVVFELSSASGILHASLYVDSVTMPYYTGLEAFTGSFMSGICRSCVCRRERLLAGGKFPYRAWSYGSFTVVSALLCRLVRGLWRQHPRRGVVDAASLGVECLAWGFTTRDVITLVTKPPLAQRGLPYAQGLARPLLVLLMLVLSKRFWSLWVALKSSRGPLKHEPTIPFLRNL